MSIGRILESPADVAEGAAWLARIEPRFAEVWEATGPWPLRRRAGGFAALLFAIVGQQVSVASAASCWARLEAAGLTDAAAVAVADDDVLRGCGLSRPKVRYVRALARAPVDYEELIGLPDAEVVTRLTALLGIGRWSAEIYASFALGRADVIAAGDLAIQEAARMLFALPDRPDDAGLRALARRCGARALGLLPTRQDTRGDRVTRILDSRRAGAAQGKATAVVVLLHGYGADGADLLGLADPLGPHMPGVAFVAPDAPERCAGSPMGFQWFPIPWIDGSSQEQAETGMRAAVGDLNAYLDSVLADEGLGADRMILLGFSQGTMMALHVAPRRAEEVAGVVGFSGRLVQPETLADEAVSRPPVLLIHGDADEVVPPQSLPDAAAALQEAGFDVYAHVMKGTGHGIAPDGLSVALAFMRERLGLERT